MSKKKKTFVTPVVECRYPFLDKPDTRYNKEGVYRIQLVFDKDHDFIDKVNKASLQEFEKAKRHMKPDDAVKVQFHSPVAILYDADGNDTGKVEIQFKSNATYTDRVTGDKKQIKVNMFDAKGKPLTIIPRVGNGSKVSVAFSVKPQVVTGKFYYTMYLNALQLIELIEFQPDGSSYGFGKHDEGFDSESFFEETENKESFDTGSDQSTTIADDDDAPF